MVKTFDHASPSLHPESWLADSAVVVGDVQVEQQASIWYGAVLRGDNASIRVGERSNIQDNVVVHCDANIPTSIGREVTVGHGAILHSCTVEDRCLIGMGAILLNGCVIGTGSLVAAGALVTQGTVVPPGSLVMGSPAKVVRPLRPEEDEDISHSAHEYCHAATGQLPAAGQHP